MALSGAAPGRRWPSVSESANLVLSGARVRLLSGLGSDAWHGAAALFALVGSVLMAAVYAESVARVVASGWTGFPQRQSTSAVVLAAAWSLAAAAVMLRWRWAAAIAASLGAAGEAVHLAIVYASNPSFLVVSWWQFTLGVVSALAAVTLVTGRRVERPPLTWPAIATVLAVAAALAVVPLAESAFATVTRYPDGAVAVSGSLFGTEGVLRLGLVAVLAIAVLVAVIRSEPAARRRVIVLAAPAVAVAALVDWTFGGFLASSARFVQPVVLTAPRWAALGLVPVLTFAAGLVLVGRHERMLRRVWRDGAASGPAA